MADFGDYSDPDLPPAERAVKYLLDRVRRDPDLRWLLLGTQAFALLCEAEAARTGWTRPTVEGFYAAPFAHKDAKRPARLELYPDLVEACEATLRGGSAAEWEAARDLVRAVLEKAKGGA
jgi:hypothetical protein